MPIVFTIRLLCVIAFMALARSLHAHALESWTDPRLSVTNQIVAWYDLSRQSAARAPHNLSPLQSWHDHVDILFDGSGFNRDLVQPSLELRPAFTLWPSSSLHFAGSNWMGAQLSELRLKRATLFLVGRPDQPLKFSALFSGAHLGRNDYVTGLNVDLGSSGETNLTLNVEGAGFGGEVNLIRSRSALGKWHVFAIAIDTNRVSLILDGIVQGSRPRNPESELALEQFVLGARFYSNTAERPSVQNFFSGDLTEALLFGETLNAQQLSVVHRYFSEKYGLELSGLARTPATEGAVPLVTVSNPPPVQVFSPGFSVRELPVDLSNINNLRYRADGKLLAVGYDGRIWLLSDTDNDGLEDHVEPFWGKQTIRAPIGAALTLPGYRLGTGVFIAAKEKLCLVLDTNSDDRADQEITVAAWKERSEQPGVDALGVAVAQDGSIYFSLGAASFTEPFLIDKSNGNARYNTRMERGTIQRVSPDFKTRETVCTGIRFAVGLAFNAEGDLFATDQEGATWRHDGNPFDELLHIQPGRHYGFPPRHPRYLPNVIDEPSTFDYAPQHQSTCGLQFNEPVNGGPTFGPTNWRGDAFIAGYSRGKLWRTKLAKTASGYVAENHLFATLQHLVIDVCISPRGDLLVATHSGQPDWGSGPTGKGKIYQIHYDGSTPQPLLAWNESATEVRVLFDRPLPPGKANELGRGARVEAGRYVFPGDRFETIRPGYQAVYDQLAAPRYLYAVLSSRLLQNGTVLSLFTKPRTMAVNYAVTLGEPGQIDLLADLTGVRCTWKSNAEKDQISSEWLPHLDTSVNRALGRAPEAHLRELMLEGKLDLFQMLQPAIQPGASIDWARPTETVIVHFRASTPFQAQIGSHKKHKAEKRSESFLFEETITAPGRQWVPYEIELNSPGSYTLTASWSTSEDSRERPFPIRRLLLPWAEQGDESGSPSRVIPEIAGGDWRKGRDLFFGPAVACSQCHTVRGEGGHVGPDLSNLTQRDYASVRKDIEFPNAAVNPDHVASRIELHDGSVFEAIVQKEDSANYSVVDASGVTQKIPKKEVNSIKPSTISLMPEGIWAGMSEEQRRDLMTFLLREPIN